MWKLFAALIVLGWCVLGTRTAGAISFEARDFDALAAEAEQIVIGTVAMTRSRRTGERQIVTDYGFDNLQIVKGTLPAGALTLTMLGGTVGADTLTVAGAPTFQRGIRYLVFVTGNGSVMFPLVGGHQGIFQVRTDATTGVTRVHDYAGRPVARPSAGASKEWVNRLDMDSAEPVTEAAFVDAIRARMGAKMGARGAQ